MPSSPSAHLVTDRRQSSPPSPEPPGAISPSLSLRSFSNWSSSWLEGGEGGRAPGGGDGGGGGAPNNPWRRGCYRGNALVYMYKIRWDGMGWDGIYASGSAGRIPSHPIPSHPTLFLWGSNPHPTPPHPWCTYHIASFVKWFYIGHGQDTHRIYVCSPG